MAGFPSIPEWLSAPLEARLARVGFKRVGRTARRRTNRKWDLLTIEPIRKSICHKWNVPFGSIAIEAACFLPFVPPKDLSQCPCCRTDRAPSSFLDGQIRLWINRQIFQEEVKNAPNLWFVDSRMPKNSVIIDEIIGVIENQAIPFFSEIEELDKFLQFLQSDVRDSAGSPGIWHIGNPGSYIRLFYTGFIALELGEWQVAHNALVSCYDTAKSLDLTSVSPATFACLRYSAALALRQEHLPPCAPT